jgi:hypothetical protein
MKFAIAFSVLMLAACTSMPHDPNAANHEAPPQVEARTPSSTNSCDTLRDSAPNCQIGDSYQSACQKFECQRAEVPCKEVSGASSTVETVEYVGAGEQSCH